MEPACPRPAPRASAARPTPGKPMVLGHNERVRKRSRWPLAAGLIAGVALDALLGDPRRGHPVAAFARAAAALEARDYADSRRRGAAHAAACVLAVAAPAVALHRRTRGRAPPQAGGGATAGRPAGAGGGARDRGGGVPGAPFPTVGARTARLLAPPPRSRRGQGGAA